MAKRRTKKDRQHAQIHRVSQPSQISQPGQVLAAPVSTKKAQVQPAVKFFSQDPRLIKTDLKKTLIVTLLVLLVLFTIALLYT